MRPRALWLSLAFAFALAVALLVAPRAALAFTPPPLEGRVTDLTRTLTGDEKATLETQLATVEQGSTVQIAVLVLSSLGGETIEDVGYTTARAWRLGQKGKDNGVLLVIATGDRRVRIEVGKGLEGTLTDLQANDIIRSRIGPELKAGRLYQGIYAGITGIAAAVAGEYAVLTNVDVRDTRQQDGMPGVIFVFIVLGAVGFAWLSWRLRGLRGVGSRGPTVTFGGVDIDLGASSSGDSSSSGFGSVDFGGSSGGSDSGGGFSGGGGDFGGGGSSDSY